MKEEPTKHIDQLWQDKLHGYREQPPAHIWAAVRTPHQAAVLLKRVGIAAAVVVASALAYWWLQGDDKAPENQQQPYVREHNTSQKQMAKANKVGSTTVYQPQLAKVSTNLQRVKQPTPIAKSEAIYDATEAIPYSNSNSTSKAAFKVDSKKVTRLPISPMASLPMQTIALDELRYPPHRQHNGSPMQAGIDFTDNTRKEALNQLKKHHNKWAFGAGFSPEWTMLQESQTQIKSYGIEAYAHRYFNNMYLASGLGLSYSTDDGKYQVEYKQAKFKGSYQYVDWVEFELDGNDVIPTYHTHRIDVYDTIDKLRVSENKNQYYYLNIPLYLGYEYAMGTRWQTNVYTGLRSGILLYKHIPNPNLEDNVFLVKTIYNDRSAFYLQAQFGISIDYQLHKHWYFDVSPNMSYYLKSPITHEDKKPYAFALRFGIKYVWQK